MDMIQDWMIINKIKMGDPDAWDILVHKYYDTFDEASYLAKVSRSMINKWADTGKFTVIKVGSRVRIRRDEFEDWMEQRDLERSMQ